MKLLAFSFAILLFSACGHAQPDWCESTTIGLTGSAGYQPIALAAHVSGKVDFRIRFTAAGEIERVQAISGPPMLIPAAEKLVAGFAANANGAIRVCAMTVNYVIHNGEWDKNCQAIQNPRKSSRARRYAALDRSRNTHPDLRSFGHNHTGQTSDSIYTLVTKVIGS